MPWGSWPETTHHPRGSISLSPLPPLTGCLDVLLWAGTLAESAVHLCKWPSQHHSQHLSLCFWSHSNSGVVARGGLYTNHDTLFHMVSFANNPQNSFTILATSSRVRATLTTCYSLLRCSPLSSHSACSLSGQTVALWNSSLYWSQHRTPWKHDLNGNNLCFSLRRQHFEFIAKLVK